MDNSLAILRAKKYAEIRCAMRHIIIYVVVVGSAAISWNCDANHKPSEMIHDMNLAQKRANLRAARETIAFMSLDQMFSDPQVHELADAAGRGDLMRIEELVRDGVDVNSKGTCNVTPLFWALHNLRGFQKLLELGAEPNVIYTDGSTVMQWATLEEDIGYLKAALQHGGNPNLIAGPDGKAPIFWAIKLYESKSDKHFHLLLESGADIDLRLANGDSLLIYAARLNRFDLVTELLKRGADYLVKNDQGYDLADQIAFKKGLKLDPNHPMTEAMNDVSGWLEQRGVRVPEKFEMKTE